MSYADWKKMPKAERQAIAAHFSDDEKAAFRRGKQAARAGKAKKGKRSVKRSRQNQRYYGGGTMVTYPNVITGRGGYFGDIGHSLGSAAGGYLGRMGGDMLGGFLEPFAGIAGLGDYTVKKNVLLMNDPPPIINPSVAEGTTVRHREYIKDIVSSGSANTFNLESFDINPGNEDLFPWLSQIAPNYEQYEIEGMIFEFRSMSADALNSTNTALGSVVMACNYDVLDDNFGSKSEMENYQWGCSAKPSCSFMHPIECAPAQTAISTILYTRGGPVPAGADARLYDWGNFQIATSGLQGTSVVVGELWVSYQIRLLKPKLFSILGNDINVYQTRSTDFSAGTDPLGTASSTTELNNTGQFTRINSKRLEIDNAYKGAYLVEVMWSGSVAAAVVAPVVSLTNAAFSLYSIGAAAQEQYPSSGTSDVYLILRCVVVTNGNNTNAALAFGVAGTLPGTPTGMRVSIVQLPLAEVLAATV